MKPTLLSKIFRLFSGKKNKAPGGPWAFCFDESAMRTHTLILASTSLGMSAYDPDRIFRLCCRELFDWSCPDSYFDPAAEIHFALKNIAGGSAADPESLLRELGADKSEMLLDLAERARAFAYIQIDERFEALSELAPFFERLRCAREKILIDPGACANAKPRRLIMV